MAITFITLIALMVAITTIRPLATPLEMPHNADVDLTGSCCAFYGGIFVISIVVLIYIVFR